MDNDNPEIDAPLMAGLEGEGETLPEPSQHAIEAMEQPDNGDKRPEGQPAPASNRFSQTDDKGNRFDPAVHAVDENGNPKKTKAGTWAKKRGRKSGSTVSDLSASNEAAKIEAQRNGALNANAEMAAGAFFTITTALGGDEWQPTVDAELGVDEPGYIKACFRNYFEANDIADLPPGWALVIGLGAYSLPRFGRPKTRSKLKGGFGRLKRWLHEKWVMAREKKPKKQGA